jgi:hypothetical protein
VSKSGGRIYSDARVDRLLIDGRPRDGRGGRVRRPRDEAATGTFRVDAPIVVLAGGALGTAELLLRNVDDDVVGRRFYINPHYFVWADIGRVHRQRDRHSVRVRGARLPRRARDARGEYAAAATSC